MKQVIEKLRERVLQILFVPSLLWGTCMFFHDEINALFSLIPGKEEGWLHNVAENTLQLVLLAVFIAGVIYLFNRFSSFLIVPESISLGWVIIRLIVYAAIIAVVLAVVIGLGWWIFVESGRNPNDVQYGMATLYMAVFGSMFFTPVCTVISVWFSAKGKHDGVVKSLRFRRPCGGGDP